MAAPTGESNNEALRLNFDRRLMLQFRGSTITSDAGLLAYRELDDALHLTDAAANTLADARTGKNGKNGRHRLEGLLRQSVFGRLAVYEDVNDAERLCRDPAIRWVVGDRAIAGSAASAIQMGRFETKWLSRPENLTALIDLPGQWIDKVRRWRRPKTAEPWWLTSLREKLIKIGLLATFDDDPASGNGRLSRRFRCGHSLASGDFWRS